MAWTIGPFRHVSSSRYLWHSWGVRGVRKYTHNPINHVITPSTSLDIKTRVYADPHRDQIPQNYIRSFLRIYEGLMAVTLGDIFALNPEP